MALLVNKRCGDVLGSVRSGLHFRASAWFILPVMTTPYGQIYAQRLGSIYCTSGLPSCPGRGIAYEYRGIALSAKKDSWDGFLIRKAIGGSPDYYSARGSRSPRLQRAA